MTRIVLLTRGDGSFGTGHLHRTAWLREVLTEQPGWGKAVDVWCEDTPVARQHFAPLGKAISFHASPVEGWLAQRVRSRSSEPVVCVVDWLDSTTEAVQGLRAAGARVVLLDDYGPAQAEADLVINCLLAPLASEDWQLGRARCVSGAQYIQLPPHVIRLRGIAVALNKALAARHGVDPASEPAVNSVPGPVRWIMVSTGGSDHYAPQSAAAVAALDAAGFGGRVTLMPYAEPLPEAWQARQTRAGMEVHALRAGPEFHDLLAGADLAILAGGLSLYEAAFLGVPAVVLPVAAHQAQTARKLAKAGCCLLAQGWEALEHAPAAAAIDALTAQLAALLSDPPARGKMSAAGQKLCDGRGLLRTAELVLELAE